MLTLNERNKVLLLGYCWGAKVAEMYDREMLMSDRVKELHSISTDSDTFSITLGSSYHLVGLNNSERLQQSGRNPTDKCT